MVRHEGPMGRAGLVVKPWRAGRRAMCARAGV